MWPKHVYAVASKPVNNVQDEQLPTLIEADDMFYDAKTDTVTATGNVSVVQGRRYLLADNVIYKRAENTVIAKGNISLKEPEGTVLFANEVKLHNELKTGIVKDFAARFADNSLMAAASGERVSEDKTVVNYAVYSPCPLCKEDPSKPPLWQVKAKKATIDAKKQRVVYNNSFFEVKGIPVFYTPYFSHPTPDASRKSGFLTPKYTHDKIFGTKVGVPYYYNIAPNKDATITPVSTSKEGGILSGQYRHMLKSGKYELEASITNPDRVDANGSKGDGKDVRGHIEGKGYFTINDVWNWGFDGKRSTDDTYLKKYNFGDEDVLTSRLYVTRIDRRNHLLFDTLSFQGLKSTDDPGDTPLIMPYIETHNEKRINSLNATAFLDTSLLSLTRGETVSSNRLSVKTGLNKTYITKTGHVFETGASLRGDGYFVDNLSDPNSPDGRFDGFENRLVPQVDLKWSWPLIKAVQKRQYMFEPIMSFAASPYGGNSSNIPNEDSQDIEFSAENLFDHNHFSGYDRIENGPRVNYGFRGGVNDYRYGSASFLFGQSYRAKRNRNFTIQSGLSDHFSDYVGKISYNNNSVFDASYKFRFDKDTLAVRNNTVSASLDISPIYFSLDYTEINDNATDVANTDSEGREIMIASTKLNITDKLELMARGNRDLSDGEWVSTRGGVLYKGSCIDISLELMKEFTRDRDIQPGTTISVQVNLKNMGGN